MSAARHFRVPQTWTETFTARESRYHPIAYHDLALRTKIEGNAIVNVRVLPVGRADSVQQVSSDHRVLAAGATERLLEMPFEPAPADTVWMRVTAMYSLSFPSENRGDCSVTW